MGDYQHGKDVDAPADQLFDFLADVKNLPRYFTSMTSAEPAEGDAVHVKASEHGRTHDAEAWFRVDRGGRHLEWGSEGPSNYHGQLDVIGSATSSRVTVSLHTERADADAESGDIDAGIRETLATIKSLVESGPAPGPTQ
ncbi:MAG: SRPBCC family protein [Marmoricola sp.]